MVRRFAATLMRVDVAQDSVVQLELAAHVTA